MMDMIVPVVVATLGAGTPLIFAALGELVTEKSGVLNLGVEGMMLVGAIVAFITMLGTGSVWLGVAAAAVAGALMALLFAFATLTLQANQVAAGLALAIFGAGVSAFIGKGYVGVALQSSANAGISLPIFALTEQAWSLPFFIIAAAGLLLIGAMGWQGTTRLPARDPGPGE